VQQKNDFTAAQRKMMVLSSETTEGLKITGIATNNTNLANAILMLCIYTCREIFCGNNKISTSFTWSKVCAFREILPRSSGGILWTTKGTRG